MTFAQTLPEILHKFLFRWNSVVGAYDCIDAHNHRCETTLTACDCPASLLLGSPCAHSLDLLAQAEDGAITEGPASVAHEVDVQRALQEALVDELINRAWDYAVQVPVPGEGPAPCFFCGRDTVSPLVDGWATVCQVCLTEGCDDE